MTDLYRKMLGSSDDEGERPEKCRQRRRRRIQMRRQASGSPPSPPASAQNPRDSPGSYSGNGSEGKRMRTDGAMGGLRSVTAPALSTLVGGGDNNNDEGEPPLVVAVEVVNEPPAPEPTVGVISIPGRSREMEDEVAVLSNFCRPAINFRRPLHFFAVYDGHGGSHVSAMCSRMMHLFVEEELMRVDSSHSTTSRNYSGVANSSGGGGGSCGSRRVGEWSGRWMRAMKRAFQRMDEAALATCSCGSVGFRCGCHPLTVAFAGSTAVVALLTPEHIIIANCGDSRAVLCRGDMAIQLTSDQKPDRPDEKARIEAAGGKVIYVNGARVEGILAMSRAIGDRYFKPVVISEPEVTILKREAEDDCLILASDGLWDVIPNEVACDIARKCLREDHPQVADPQNLMVNGIGHLYPTRSILAAAILTRLALGRNSADNISTIVVDLKNS